MQNCLGVSPLYPVFFLGWSFYEWSKSESEQSKLSESGSANNFKRDNYLVQSSVHYLGRESIARRQLFVYCAPLPAKGLDEALFHLFGSHNLIEVRFEKRKKTRSRGEWPKTTMLHLSFYSFWGPLLSFLLWPKRDEALEKVFKNAGGLKFRAENLPENLRK